MLMSSTNSATPPSGTAAIAMGRHREMMALEPLMMVPKKKISANTRGSGTGSPPKKTGSSWITPVDVIMSLNTMISTVLKMITGSKAVKNIGRISHHFRRSTNMLSTVTRGVAM